MIFSDNVCEKKKKSHLQKKKWKKKNWKKKNWKYATLLFPNRQSSFQLGWLE